MTMEKLTLRAFSDADVPRLTRWLAQPHVAQWYAHPADWIREVENRNGAFRFIRHLIAEVDGTPVGFCQYYRYVDGGETWYGGNDPAGAYSIDYLIGETRFLRKGYGKRIVREMASLIAECDDAKRVIVQPEKENRISRRTLLACGFLLDESCDVFALELPGA